MMSLALIICALWLMVAACSGDIFTNPVLMQEAMRNEIPWIEAIEKLENVLATVDSGDNDLLKAAVEK